MKTKSLFASCYPPRAQNNKGSEKPKLLSESGSATPYVDDIFHSDHMQEPPIMGSKGQSSSSSSTSCTTSSFSSSSHTASKEFSMISDLARHHTELKAGQN
uniref:Uncharacterized protein n=1 Tax=Nelumbo nucifera TaxID=4432 RepID=A0A822YNV8_NELNU|nr:TPA_asm: hypothetical protein HUJ06_004837 [Nelumbo nucifera]